MGIARIGLAVQSCSEVLPTRSVASLRGWKRSTERLAGHSKDRFGRSWGGAANGQT